MEALAWFRPVTLTVLGVCVCWFLKGQKRVFGLIESVYKGELTLRDALSLIAIGRGRSVEV